MKHAFGDFELDWRGQRMRRGGGWVLIGEDTADILEALMIADGLRLSGEALWRALPDRNSPFDGRQLAAMVADANADLADLDVQIVVEAFTCRLADMTRRALRLSGGS